MATYNKHLVNNNLAAASRLQVKPRQPVAPESAVTILPQVKLTIQPGQTSPTQRHAWDAFWKHLISEVSHHG